jgi:hypothetical protein
MKNTTTLREKVKCDFCGLTANYDGKTILGPWSYMCKRCFINEGMGLGIGRGQEINYI